MPVRRRGGTGREEISYATNPDPGRRSKVGRDHLRQASAPAPGPAPGRRRGLRTALGALAGLLAAAVALGFAELIAGLVGPASSPVIAVGRRRHHADAGDRSRSSRSRTSARTTRSCSSPGRSWSSPSTRCWSGSWGCAAGASARSGSPCSVSSARSPPSPAPPGARSTCCRRSSARRPGSSRCRPAAPLTARAGLRARPRRPRPAPHADERMVDRLREVLGSGDRKGAGLDRRRFFLTSGVALGVAAVAGGGGRLLQRRFDVAEARADLALPAPASRGRRAPAGADLAGGRGADPAVHGEPGVLPGRHRDQRAADPARRLPAVDDRDVRLAPQLHAAGPVRARRPHRARHHAHLRLQRGRRPAGRHRAVARRPARRVPAGERRPVRAATSWCAAPSTA